MRFATGAPPPIELNRAVRLARMLLFQRAMTDNFVLDMERIRERAKREMEKGAVTEAYRADREQVIQVLNEALATEIVCTLRYKNHYYRASGIRGREAAAEFLEHAQEEQEHADQIAERITQLGGIPDLNPKGLETRAHAEYTADDTNSLEAMLKEDLIAERIAIDVYSQIIQWLGDKDPTTRRMIEGILETEEEHADDIADLLEGPLTK